MWVHPLRIGHLLRSAAVHPPQRRCILGFDPFGLRQPLQVLRIAFPAVPPHDRPHGRVGFQRGGVNADRLALQQAPFGHQPQHPSKHFLVRRLVHQPPRARDRHMIRRLFIQPNLQKLPQTQGIGHPPGDASLAVDPLEEADQHQPEVHPRRQRRSAQPLVVELPAPTLAESIKIGFLQQLVQPPVERVSGRLGQLCPIPQRLLSLTMLARSHGHGPIVSKNISEVTCFFPIWRF